MCCSVNMEVGGKPCESQISHYVGSRGAVTCQRTMVSTTDLE